MSDSEGSDFSAGRKPSTSTKKKSMKDGAKKFRIGTSIVAPVTRHFNAVERTYKWLLSEAEHYFQEAANRQPNFVPSTRDLDSLDSLLSKIQKSIIEVTAFPEVLEKRLGDPRLTDSEELEARTKLQKALDEKEHIRALNNLKRYSRMIEAELKQYHHEVTEFDDSAMEPVILMTEDEGNEGSDEELPKVVEQGTSDQTHNIGGTSGDISGIHPLNFGSFIGDDESGELLGHKNERMRAEENPTRQLNKTLENGGISHVIKAAQEARQAEAAREARKAKEAMAKATALAERKAADALELQESLLKARAELDIKLAEHHAQVTLAARQAAEAKEAQEASDSRLANEAIRKAEIERKEKLAKSAAEKEREGLREKAAALKLKEEELKRREVEILANVQKEESMYTAIAPSMGGISNSTFKTQSHIGIPRVSEEEPDLHFEARQEHQGANIRSEVQKMSSQEKDNAVLTHYDPLLKTIGRIEREIARLSLNELLATQRSRLLEEKLADQEKNPRHENYEFNDRFANEEECVAAYENMDRQNDEPRFESTPRMTKNHKTYNDQNRIHHDESSRVTHEFSTISDPDKISKFLIKFNGTGNFNLFRETFEYYVTNNPNLPSNSKYILLEKHLCGEAMDCLQKLENTRLAVSETFFELKKVYGKKSEKMSLHEKFNSLHFHKSDCKQMVLDLSAHRSAINLLREQGVNVNDERTITPFCRKLPDSILSEILPTITKNKDRLTFELVHDAVDEAIENLQTKRSIVGAPKKMGLNEIQTISAEVHVAQGHQAPSYRSYKDSRDTQYNGNPRGDRQRGTPREQSGKYGNSNQGENDNFKPIVISPDEHPSEFKDPTSGETLEGFYKPGYSGVNLTIIPYSFPFPQDEPNTICGACDGRHNAIRCPLKSWEFRKAQVERRLCKLCNSKTHSIYQCRNTILCGYCRGMHHMGACPEKERYRDRRNYPQRAGPIKTSSRSAGTEAMKLRVPPTVLPTDSCSINTVCSTKSNSKSSGTPRISLSYPKRIVKSLTPITKSICTGTKKFVKFLRSRRNHVNHVASLETKKDSDYRLPFMLFRTTDGQTIRVLSDSGATLSIVSHHAAERLGLENLTSTNLTVSGYNTTVTFKSNIYKLSIRNKFSDEPFECHISGSPQLAPTSFRKPVLSSDDIRYLKENNLDIQEFSDQEPHDGLPIDMIMGTEIISWFQSLPETERHVLPSGRILESTPFGMLVHPTPNINLLYKAAQVLVESNPDKANDPDFVMTLLDTSDPEDPLIRLIAEVAQMWNVENIGATAPGKDELTKKVTLDLIAEFEANAKYNLNGELEVALPFNGNESRLANNYSIAITRLANLIMTLKKGKNMMNDYHEIIQSQLASGIIEEVTDEMKEKGYPTYYIPHRVVVKMSSNTTKLRIVYDASSHRKGELSLNDCVHPGPSILQSIFGILIRARMYRYIIVADIEKAFHQVRLQPEFRDLTRFVWLIDPRKPPTPDNIAEYHFNRIPFGVACSPFLLAATIYHYLQRNPHEMNEMLKENLYVDNCLFYTNDIKKILEIIEMAKQIFNKMNMNLREFIVNEAKMMEKILEKDRAASSTIKILGYDWDTVSDEWFIKIAELREEHPTKRQVASRMAETFDPLGLVSPILVPFKRLMKKAWNDGINWNDPLSPELLVEWQKLRTLFRDKKIVLPRQLTDNYDYSSLRIMMFSDASHDIYAAAAYAHYSFEDRQPVVKLLASKNKIKPANQDKWTIPKLELMAIELASNLAVTAADQIREKITEVCFFTDSSCALFWILSRKNTRLWVSNRVEAIHKNNDSLSKLEIETTIRHCPTKENPADIATRGMGTHELQHSSLWFNGPEFLKNDRKDWPCKIEGSVSDVTEFQKLVYSEVIDPKTNKKIKPLLPRGKFDVPLVDATVMTLTKGKFKSIVPWDYTKSLSKLVIIVRGILRMVRVKAPKHCWQSYWMKEFATPDDATYARQRNMTRTFIIQQHYLEVEANGWHFPSDWNLIKGEDGLLRIRTQVKSSVLPREAHEPIAIHHKHELAQLIIRETHENNGHLPAVYTSTTTRLKYRIKGDLQIANGIISKCVDCRKVKARPFEYPNCQVLPSCRTEPSTPFQHVGLDYLGPILYRKDDGTKSKCYVLVYTCLTTRGARLEPVPDGTTERFIEALGIMIRRCGIPDTVYCDNAKTFSLAGKIINDDIFNGKDPSESLTSFLASESINFRNITPLAPWQGGIYERIVGIVKHQLTKEVGPLVLDFHSLRYVLAGVECMINSRPLTPHPSRFGDFVVLRPIDLQLPAVMLDWPGAAQPFYPKGSAAERRTRAHLAELDGTLERLWKMWALGYLLNLRESKHKGKKCSTLKPKVGQVVLIHTELVRRQKWPLGVIVEVLENSEGNIQSAKVRCRGTFYVRPVCQLIPLEVEELVEEESVESETHEDGSYKEEIFKSKPIPPSPAIFDIPNAKYAPQYFIPQSGTHPVPTKDPAIPAANHPIPHTSTLETVGEKVENGEEINYDQPRVDQDDVFVEYEDPNESVDKAREALPTGRTREYAPRRAKAPYINYVHKTVASLASSSPPECCEFQGPALDLHNLMVL